MNASELIQASLESVAEKVEDLTPAVYARFFALHPEALTLFGEDAGNALKGQMLMRDIAAQCGITLPSIYHFFGDKESLYNHCVAASFSEAQERMTHAIEAGASPREKVQQAMVAVCDMLLNNDNLRRLLQRAMLRRDYREGIDYFPLQFQLVTDELRKLGYRDNPQERAFALYAMALGVVQFRPVAERVGIEGMLYSTPVHLAEYVLKTVLPELR